MLVTADAPAASAAYFSDAVQKPPGGTCRPPHVPISPPAPLAASAAPAGSEGTVAFRCCWEVAESGPSWL